SSRRRHTRFSRDWSSDVCSSDLPQCVKAHNAGRNLQLRLAFTFEKKYVTNFYSFWRNLRAGLHRAWVLLQNFDSLGCIHRCTSRSEERRVGKESRSRWAT